MSAADTIAALIRREGAITFDAFMDVALYDTDVGFFGRGHGAGRRGRDFVTSPEIGPLFGACIARALDDWWRELGASDPFLVVEAGAGSGRLAREIHRAEPACLSALRYVLVERSQALRAQQRELLPLEPADEALGPFVHRDADEELVPVRRAGPVFASVADLPEMASGSVVIANELLDNLSCGIAHWDGTRWQEVRVGTDGSGFREVLVPAAESDAVALQRIVEGREVPIGARLPIPRGLEAWFDECAGTLPSGLVAVFDYIVDVDEVLRRGTGWLRTYRGHGRGTDALREPGSQDITTDVVREQLEHAAHASGFRVVHDATQAEWLGNVGIDELVAAGKRAWDAGAARGDLGAIAGRSRASEAAALTDPGGLGAHRVVTLAKSTGPSRRDRR
jgi:NADH dehydrogenase [ubiquinone] 1 alpha subcomplex assembly factor 7